MAFSDKIVLVGFTRIRTCDILYGHKIIVMFVVCFVTAMLMARRPFSFTSVLF